MIQKTLRLKLARNLLFLLFFSLNGCASFVNTSCMGQVYGGVMLDVSLVRDRYNTADKTVGSYAFMGLLVIDVPLSAVFDTILFPVNAFQDNDNCHI